MPADAAEKASAKPSETSPLLGRANGLRAGLEEWWRTGTTASFRFAASYSYRVALFTGLIVSLPLLISHGRRRFAEFGIPVHLIVCNMLFIIGPNVGATLAAGFRAMVGSLMAGLMIRSLDNIYPGGFAPDGSPVPFAFTFFWSFIYIFVVLALNINEGVRFFAIGEYLPHMMTFLNPAKTLNAASAVWRIDIFAGSFLALLCSLVPQPIFAMDSLRGAIKDLSTSIFPLTRRCLEYYCGTSPSLEYYELVAEMQTVKAKLDSAKNTLEASWFECLGGGSAARARLMIGELIDEFRIIVLHLQPLAPICGRETFDESHARIAGKLQQPLLVVCDRVAALGEKCVQASMDGALDEQEAAALRSIMEDAHSALKELRHSVGTEVGHDISEKTTGERAIVCAVCAMAQHTIKRTEALLAWESPLSSWVSGSADYLRSVFSVSLSELKWAARNFFTLWICIVLGCFAFHYVSFLEPFTYGPAYIVAVLLSRFVACGLSNAKTRIAMVVMAKVIGQAGWIAFGHCRLSSQIVTLVLNVTFVQSFMFFAYMGGENASFAIRMAAMGVLELLRPCSEDWVTLSQYGHDYHEVIDNVTGVAVLLLVDMTLGQKSASVRAVEAVREALLRYQQVFTAYFRAQKNEQVVIRDIRTVTSMLDTASSAGASAKEEATLWRQPWRPDLFTDLVIHLTQLCQELHNVVHVLGDDVRPLNSLPAFRQTSAALVEKVDRTVDLAMAALRHDWDAVAEQAKLLPYNPEDAGHGIEHLDKLVKELDAHATKLVPATCAFPRHSVSEPSWILERRLKESEVEKQPEGSKGAEHAPEEKTHRMQSLSPRLSLSVETLLSVSELLGKLQQRIIILKYR